ncbi:MAG TPA: VOC family protein [Kineosporiaceae bacterium]|nr:VOC family protein [Kineosporiaceae bacterium]
MITGSHVILYTTDADADRAFLRDVLGFPHVDAGAGWLIFRLPPAEVAFHPTEGPSLHELFLMCDDLQETMRELTGRGVEFTQPVSAQRWGALTGIRLPGGGEIGLYEPYHERATDLESE